MTLRGGRLIVGLTGGIACGKSTALKCLLMKVGWATLSADLIANNILRQTKLLSHEISRTFWYFYLKSCGNIDKEALGGIIFDKNTERNGLKPYFIL